VEPGERRGMHRERAQADANGDSRARMQRVASAILFAGLTLLALWTIHAFVSALAWAGVIAIALWPVLQRFERTNGSALHRITFATVATAAVGLLFVLPLIFGAGEALRDAHEVTVWFQNVQDNGIPMPDLLNHLPVGSKEIVAWWQTNLGQPLRASPALKSLHGQTLVTMGHQFGARAAHVAILFGFMLLALFFILQAGARLSTQLSSAARRAFGAHGALLLTRMVASVRGTVTGLVVVGLGEGALLGIAYLIAGVPHAALLGALTAVAAMLPFCAPLVFCGAAVWLLTQSAMTAAVALAVFGFIVVFVAEHFVRPILIGGATRLPFLLVLLGILGGAETFGLIGLFIGPAVMTVLMTLWREWAA
jgi:predicted PurR-regulated permease PerM